MCNQRTPGKLKVARVRANELEIRAQSETCSDGYTPIALVYGIGAEALANARLLAASKGLLAACKVLLDHASMFNRDTDAAWCEIRDLAANAIRAADEG